nr:variable large family protein [Borreliella bissettiae]
MIKAANEAATKGGTGGSEKIGDSAANGGVKADKDSVNEIAKGIKGIVDAAGKADGGKGDALKDVKAAEAAGDDGNADAGKLFAVGAAGGNAAAADIGKAAAAVSEEQILKAIVDAAGKEAEQAGAKASEAKNPIAAAIGTAAAGAAFGE